ncbi:M20 metallopeptidase family protein [Ilumatobacter nonamiensis]|uniref:M20 metallopeptidase family protein n=1 Tax=Ilumatobacter nonamiensis TaxID=467093 RepID=UPI00034564FE|nr:M20 family metallopeptidase [Ilumatobacter nonamiensis]
MSRSSSDATDPAGSEQDPQIASVSEHAGEYLDRATAMRRRLHEWPEIGNHLPRTREQVLAEIDDLPLDVTLHESTSGVTALLEGSRPGPTILLRGDMDALPMPEDTGLDFASQVDGCMHACGHDTHTAMLAGAARVLSERRDEITGRVMFMFQPGEEGHHGAKHMLDEGLLDVPAMHDGTPSPVTGAFAIHMTSALPTGWVSTRPGAVMASADVLRVTVTGQGGHASEPYRAVDPVPVACEIVTALNSMVTRSIDPFDPAVLTVTRLVAGTTNNVIPETAMIEGTIRAVSERTRAKVHDGLRRVAEGIAAAHGCGAEVTIDFGYPVTTNDDRFADFSLGLGREVAGHDAAVELPNPVMGAEDFSYLLNEVPGAMVFLGGTPHDANLAKAAPNHSNRVFFEEAAMTTGIALYSAVALRQLA